MKRVVLLDNSLLDLTPEKHVTDAHGAELVVLENATEQEAIEAVKGASILLSQGASFPVTARIIESMQQGGYVLKYGAGYDNIDIETATRRNIQVTHLPDGTTNEVAEHTAALILCLLRRLTDYSDSLKSGQWKPTLDNALIRPYTEITIGLIGYGRIGRLVHEKLRSLGFKFAAYDPYQDASSVPEDLRLIDLRTLAQEAQVLSLHLGATPESIGLVNKELLEILGSEGYVVNTSRGVIIDEDDLVDALMKGTIAGAALDAFVVEPLPVDSKLHACQNLLISPHASFYSTSSNERVQKLLSEELDRALSGHPVRCLIREQKLPNKAHPTPESHEASTSRDSSNNPV